MMSTHPIPTEAIEIYLGERFQVAGHDYGSDTLILTFSERKEPKPADFFGLSFCNKERLSWIAVRSLENDWYIGDEMDQVFDTIRQALQTIKHERLILFGYSMGSFGVIRAANIFSPSRIIIGGPIATLDPKIEKRWLSDYRDLLPLYEQASPTILPWKKPFETVAMFDPKCDDSTHVKILEQSSPIKKLEVPGAGHLVLTYLRDSGVLGMVMRMLLKPHIDLPTITTTIRRARKNNRSYLLPLAERLSHRPWLQQRVLNHAMRVIPDDWEIQLARVSPLSMTQNYTDAATIINDVTTTHNWRCFGVPLGKAVYSFLAAGGNANDIPKAIQMLASDRPRSREVQLWYSRCLRQMKSYDEAFAAHEVFMTGDTFEAHAHVERGLIFEQCGLRYAARDSLRVAYDFAPKLAAAKQNLKRLDQLLAKN